MSTPVKTIFLDYDGTLHDSMAIYKPAFLKAYATLVKKQYAEAKDWTDEAISKFLGQTPKEMWASFGDAIPEAAKQEASLAIGNTMETMIKAHQAKLYNGAIETLKTLKARGYTLVFISNCKTQYMENHTEVFQLDRYFDAMVCAEMYDYAPKTDVLKTLKQRFQSPYAMVGDRHHDIDAGKAHQMVTVACTYGFGSDEEHTHADYKITDITELKAIFT